MARIGIFSLDTEPHSIYINANSRTEAITQFRQRAPTARITCIVDLTHRRTPWFPDEE